ncbi:MAG: PAS domain S-box-containing protein [Algoriphagus sp.]|jgi:PAS domain S-box-containing protein
MDKQKKIKLEILAEIKALKGANEILKNQKEFTQANKLNFDSFHLFFMKSSLPMWVYGKHTYLVLDVNKAACKIYDYSREEFLKMSILDFGPKKDKERLLANLKKPRPERFFSKGCRHQFKNGQVIDVEVSSQELNYEGKEAVMVVAHDIKSKVEPKNMVKQSEEKFRLITTHAKDAIILMDEKDCVTLWNPAAEKIFGFTQEEVIGKNLRSFIMPQRYSEQMKKGFIHFIKSGQGPLIGNLIEIEALHKSGHEFPISMSVAAFKLNNKWNAAATVRDITEQKTAPQKLLQSEEKEKRVDELTLANKALTFQNEEKEKRVDELTLANTELAFQNKEKEKRADELALANTEIAFQNEEKEKRADELALANTELAFQNEEKEKRADELILANKELAFQNKEKQKRADELALANTELAFQNEEKQKRADELALANTELAFQNEEKQKRADELTLANTELAFQNKEKEKRADELALANSELAFQNEEKEKRADELALANTELAFQNEEKQKRADELTLANTELAFQNKEKEKRADELALANTELAFQNREKEKRADELALANTELAFQNEEKQKRADELALANTELAFQNEEKEKRADELALANMELAFQNEEKQKRADELALANTELAFQNEEKEKRADELALANTELAFQNEEKQKRADELALANTELAFQNKEKEKRADELALAKTELAFQNREKEKRADELILANKELSFQKKLDVYRSEMESVAHDLTRLIDTANAPIFGIDNKGLVNEWNQSSEKITGFKKEEVLGKDLVETYITEDYRKAVKLVLDNALKGKETANYEFPLFTKDQRRVMVLLNSSTRRNAAGKIVGVLGVGQDISQMDKLRTETEAIATELRQFIETANAPIFGIDAKGKVNEWNQSSEKITGFKKEEVRGKDLVETYITEDYREAVKLVLDNALKGKETANFEFPLFTKDQRRVMVLLNSSTRRNADGEITGVLGVGQDISQMDNYKTNLEDTVQKRTFELENSLEREKELGKIKTSFVAMASHEFRTPLAAIQAATDVILRYKDKLSQEDIDKRLFKIKREVRDMTIILEDILILGKSEVQKLKFRAIELDLVVLVKNIVSDYQLTQEKPREVAYKISKDNIMLNADPKWIKHIIINLLSNALKYSEAPASIIIEIRQEKTEVILSVSDQGIGISEKDQAILFEPFNRGENVGNIQGTGLGLSILQKAIDLHKGKIKIESKLNNGSTFIVSLPYEGMG